ncbi:hypothetical protein TrLO_g5021 [Triparma laevis f. longispina]|uniref:Uncharacterized protein n=1 Tax=Triparma laevis f. longispina TaxID=1714387 RepID=A0A9W7B3V4_9STRA|nr:hypothetical protein TrLO_g5021 [Triparma laevis f. longispina]
MQEFFLAAKTVEGNYAVAATMANEVICRTPSVSLFASLTAGIKGIKKEGQMQAILVMMPKLNMIAGGSKKTSPTSITLSMLGRRKLAAGREAFEKFKKQHTRDMRKKKPWLKRFNEICVELKGLEK